MVEHQLSRHAPAPQPERCSATTTRCYQNVFPGSVDVDRHAGQPLGVQQRDERPEHLSTRPTSSSARPPARCATPCSPAWISGGRSPQLPQYRLLQRHRDLDDGAARPTHDPTPGHLPPERDRCRQPRARRLGRACTCRTRSRCRRSCSSSRGCGSSASISRSTTSATARTSTAPTTWSRPAPAWCSSRWSRSRSTAATACPTCRAPATSSRR